MSEEAHNIQHEIKKYFLVFFGLLVLTVVTVAASSLKIGVILGVILALIIATVKGSLVACHFMHLNSEKKLIYLVLVLTIIFFAAMMFLICAAHYSVPEGATFVS